MKELSVTPASQIYFIQTYERAVNAIFNARVATTNHNFVAPHGIYEQVKISTHSSFGVKEFGRTSELIDDGHRISDDDNDGIVLLVLTDCGISCWVLAMTHVQDTLLRWRLDSSKALVSTSVMDARHWPLWRPGIPLCRFTIVDFHSPRSSNRAF